MILDQNKIHNAVMAACCAVVLLSCATAGAEDIVYSTNFDALTTGQTVFHPGDPGHGGWYRVMAEGDAYGEIQGVVAASGNALHEHTHATNPTGQQTIDARELTPPNLCENPIITLDASFLSHSSELSYTNPYSAGLRVGGSPHPGFEILGIGLNGGNGTAKSDTGVSVGIVAFDGVSNHYSIPLTVGQGLSWDEWHSVTLVADQASDTYVSIIVDGQSQDLSSYQLPRSFDCEWIRGELIEDIRAEIVPSGWVGQETDDDVYWDDIALSVDDRLPPQVVYSTNFDDLATGQTVFHPGDPGQGGWYKVIAMGDAYGEIQGVVAASGNALHEHTHSTSMAGMQTIDARELTPPDLCEDPIITLDASFLSHSSELSYTNPYSAGLRVGGGPHPGFEILGIGLNGGNGTAKTDTGVSVGIVAFNGVDNHYSIPLSVGQGLSWDEWHSVTLVADQANDTYVSVAVDGQSQDLSGYQLPRSHDGEWIRGELIENIRSEIVPAGWVGQETDDDVYWDNISLTVESLDAPPATGDYDHNCLVDLEDYVMFVDCMAGPDVTPDPSFPDSSAEKCLGAFDFDGEGDVDMADFAEFQLSLGES